VLGYRGGRSSWDNNNSSRQGFGSDSGRWGHSAGGFSDNRNGGGFRSKIFIGYDSRYICNSLGRGGGESSRDGGDRGKQTNVKFSIRSIFF
jgi:hypothetical protein